MTALRTLQRSLTSWVGAAVLILGLMLMALFGLATIVVPAGVGILAIELARARRWLLGYAGGLPRRTKPSGKEVTGCSFSGE